MIFRNRNRIRFLGLINRIYRISEIRTEFFQEQENIFRNIKQGKRNKKLN
jgi:hypothetical protein